MTAHDGGDFVDDGRAKGYVKIARRLFDGDPLWLEPRVFSQFEAWVDLIQMAAYAPHNYPTARGVVHRDRGELVGSIRYLASRWRWKEKRVRYFLAMCQKRAQLRAQRATPDGTVYLVVNYERYQSTSRPNAPRKGTAKGTAGAQQGHKKEGSSNTGKEGTALVGAADVTPIGFARCWNAYPARKGGNSRRKAERAYLTRVRSGVDEEHLFRRTQAYRVWCDAERKTGTKFVMMAATFYGPDARYDEDFDVGNAPDRNGSSPVTARNSSHAERARVLFDLGKEYGLLAFSSGDDYERQLSLTKKDRRAGPNFEEEVRRVKLWSGIGDQPSDFFAIREIEHRLTRTADATPTLTFPNGRAG